MRTLLKNWRRPLLVLVLLAVGLGVWRLVKTSQTAYYLEQAQAARAAGDLTAAQLHLQNAIQRQPDRADARLALAQVYLDAARATGKQATYETQPNAFHQLVEAARYRPQDVALQKRVLGLTIKMERYRDAAAIAPRVLQREPENADALFALSWSAADKFREAQAEVKRLTERCPELRFQSTQMRVLLDESYDNHAHAQVLLDSTLDRAAKEEPTFWKNLSDREWAACRVLLLKALETADAPDQATARASLAVTALERAAQSLPPTKPAATDKPTAPQLTPRLDEAADLAARIHARWYARNSDRPQTALQVGAASNASTKELTDRFVKLLDQAVVDQRATPVVYREAAQIAADRGNSSREIELLRAGLAATATATGPTKQEAQELRSLLIRRLIVAGRTAETRAEIKALSADPKLQAEVHFLSAWANLNEGKFSLALDQALAAQRLMGHTLPIHALIAGSHLGLQQWPAALKELAVLRAGLDAATPASADSATLVGSKNEILWAEFVAHLALDQPAATTKRAALADTPWAARAAAMTVQTLQARGRREAAADELAKARQQFPHDAEILSMALVASETRDGVEGAEQLLAKTLQDAPNDFGVQMVAARWYMNHAHPELALKLLASIKTAADDTRSQAVVQALRAQALLANGELDKAIAAVEPLLNTTTTQPIAQLVQAAAQAQRKQWASATEALDALQPEAANNPLVAVLRGELAVAVGDNALAAESWGDLLDITAIRTQAQRATTAVLLRLAQERDAATAEAATDKLLAKHPDEAVLLLVKIDFAARQQHFDSALTTLAKLDEPNGTVPPATIAYLRGWLRLQQGQADEALAEAQRALQLSPRFAPALLLRAEASIAAAAPAAALQAVEAAQAGWPQQAELAVMRAECLMRLDRANEARAVLEPLLERRPPVMEAYNELASVEASTGNFARAIEVCRLGRSAGSDAPRLAVLEAAALLQLKRPDDAATAAERLVERFTAAQCLDLARVFFRANDGDRGALWAQRALDHSDASQAASLDARLMLGAHTLGAGLKTNDQTQLAKARDYYAAIVAGDPTQLIAVNNLSWLLAERFQDVAAAVRVIEPVRARVPAAQWPPDLLGTMALVLRRADQTPAALKLLESNLAAHGRSPQVQLQWGLALEAVDRKAEAARAFNAVLELEPDEAVGQQAREAQRRLTATSPTGSATAAAR